VQVYPKSAACLLELHDIERYIAFLAAHRELLRESPAPQHQTLVQRVSAELMWLYAVAAWAMISEGPGFPWPESVDHPEPPDFIRQFGPLDFLRVFDSFHRLNRLNDELLSILTLPTDKVSKEGARRPHLAGFLSMYAVETGIPHRRLLRDFDLPGLLTAARLNASMQREAYEEAKTRVENDSPPDLRQGA
jgi:hypothetical protein